MLLQHLALVDTFVCIMGIGISIQNTPVMIGNATKMSMLMTGDATIDLLVCQAWHGQTLYWGGVLLSVWNLVLITVERFVMISYPYKHRNIRPAHIYVVLVIVYTLSVISLAPAYLHLAYDDESGECMNERLFFSLPFDTFLSFFAIFWFLILYAIPIAFIIALYTKIILILRKRQQNLMNLMDQRSRILEIADQQLTRTAIAVAIVFIISLSWDAWFYVLGLVGIVSYDFNSSKQMVGVFLATFSSCANPFIYFATMAIFRKSLQKTFRCGSLSKYSESSDKRLPKSTTPSKDETKKMTSDTL